MAVLGPAWLELRTANSDEAVALLREVMGLGGGTWPREHTSTRPSPFALCMKLRRWKCIGLSNSSGIELECERPTGKEGFERAQGRATLLAPG